MNNNSTNAAGKFSGGEFYIVSAAILGTAMQGLGEINHVGTRILLAVCVGGGLVLAFLLARSV
jgi:hypothetical protein